jgi:GR25 family glycosyltransferase involved in LPS biosynthesis
MELIPQKNIQYYIIHNLEIERKNIMLNEFKKWGFNLDKIKWLNYPNKNDITDDLVDKLIIHPPNDLYFGGKYLKNSKGIISCTYKHYMALKDIVDNDYDYGVIIEDNIQFKDNVPNLIQKYIEQLDKYYNDNWDILFEGEMFKYIEKPLQPNILVYPKSNEITYFNNNIYCHGGTRAATFYLVKKECAKKLIEHYLPFSMAPDWWMNHLFRKLNIKSFWVEPSIVYVQPNHISTAN